MEGGATLGQKSLPPVAISKIMFSYVNYVHFCKINGKLETLILFMMLKVKSSSTGAAFSTAHFKKQKKKMNVRQSLF